MITHCQLLKRLCSRLLVVLCLALSVGGCATGMSNSGYPADTGTAVPEYVRNLPKSRTGNMDEYTVFGKRYRVMNSAANFIEQGKASWYGAKFHGRKTSSGEIYDMYAMTAAHKHLPLPTYVRVTNLENAKSIVVKVNDRGPFVGSRIIDLSLAAAQALDMVEQGTAQVRVDGLSTHLIAENQPESNQTEANQHVVRAIDASSGNIAAQAPAVIEPVLAAVPLLASAEKVQLAARNASDNVDIAAQIPLLGAAASAVAPASGIDGRVGIEIGGDSSDDGFMELTDSAPSSADYAIDTAITVSTASTASTENLFIQLGAFSHAPNAHSLVVDVAEQVGLPAYVEQDANRAMFRVKMGPFTQGELLDNTLLELTGVGFDGYTLQAVSH